MVDENKKVVLIGGPSSGKSTLIDEFESRGFPVIREIARRILTDRQHYEITPLEIEIRQRLIYDGQMVAEKAIEKEGLVFLDRGRVDNIAYSEHLLGYVPFSMETGGYYQIFSLERLPFIEDGLRIERSEDEARELHERILKVYEKSGYDLIHVPVFEGAVKEAVAKRADFILSKLEEMSND